MTNVNHITLVKVQKDKKHSYSDYLLLADESEAAVNEYINEGDMFAIHYENQLAGAMVFIYHANQVVELKNIALDASYRGRGLGKSVMAEICALFKQEGLEKIIVGTANSSIGNLAFYQKAGFRMTKIKKDFFRQYPEPVFEDGIRALDMVMFEKRLQE